MDVRNVPGPVKRMVHLGSRSYGRLTAPARMTAVVPDLRRPALRHHVAVPGAGRAPGGAQGGAAQGRALLRHVVPPGHGLVPRALPDAAQRGQDRRSGTASPAQTFESSPYYMYHPQAVARIAQRPARRQAGRAGPRPGRAGVLAARARGGPRLRAGARLRQRARAGAGPAAPPGGEARRATRTYYSFAHQHHAYRARGEYARYLSVMAAARRPGPDPRGGERAVLQRPGVRLRRGARLPRAAHPPGPAAVRAAQRPAAPDRHGPGPAPGADRALRPARRGAGELAGPGAGLAPADRDGLRERTRTPRPGRPGRALAAGWPTWSAPPWPAPPGWSSPGSSRGRSAPSRPARSSPPRPRSCWPAAWRSWAPRPGWSTGRPGCAPPAATICSAPACGPRWRR